MAKKIKSAAPLTPDIPRTILSTTTDEPDEPRRARRIQDASRALGISRTTIYNLAAAGKIRLIKIGGRTLVPESEINRLVELVEGAA